MRGIARSGVLGLLFLVTLIDKASAQAGGALSPLNTVMSQIQQFMTGPFGQTCGIMAVGYVGYQFLMGRASWGIALVVALGIALIFGAAQIVSVFQSVGN